MSFGALAFGSGGFGGGFAGSSGTIELPLSGTAPISFVVSGNLVQTASLQSAELSIAFVVRPAYISVRRKPNVPIRGKVTPRRVIGKVLVS